MKKLGKVTKAHYHHHLTFFLLLMIVSNR